MKSFRKGAGFAQCADPMDFYGNLLWSSLNKFSVAGPDD